MKIVYNKLVRDLIPEIIEKSGNRCVIRILNDQEYTQMLEEKLMEECAEYKKDKTLEELADVLEVVYALANAKGLSREDIEKIRVEKAQKRGAFKRKIFLKEVDERE